MAQTQLPGNMGVIDWTGWTRGILTAVIGGGSGAVSAGFGTMVVDPKDFNIYTLKLYAVMGACFAFNGFLSMMAYLHNKPIPDIITETTVTRREVEPTEEKPTPPPPVVTTTIKETKVEPAPEKE